MSIVMVTSNGDAGKITFCGTTCFAQQRAFSCVLVLIIAYGLDWTYLYLFLLSGFQCDVYFLYLAALYFLYFDLRCRGCPHKLVYS